MSTTATTEFPQVLKTDYNTENNTWGDILNTNWEVVARALGGVESIAIGGSADVTITETQFSHRLLLLTGVLTADINLIVPAKERSFLVQNAATGSFDVTVKTASGTGITIPAATGAIWPMTCDGSNVQIGLKKMDCSVMGVITNFQSTGINDAATSTVITITAAGRINLASGTIFSVDDGILASKYNSASDIDHIFHDTDTWYLVTGGTARSTSSSTASSLQAKNLALVNGGTLDVAGAATLDSTLDVGDDTTVAGDLDIAVNCTIGGTLTVTGALSAGNIGSAASQDETYFALSGHSHTEATQSLAGMMSATDKQKLDGLPLGVGFSDGLLHVVERQTVGTDNGTFANTAGGVNRSWTHTVTNEISGASVSTTDITLPTGTYYIEATLPAYRVDGHRAKLRNHTASTDVLQGGTEHSPDSTSASQTRSFIHGRFVVSSASVYRIIHACVTSRTSDGRGKACNLGTGDEVYGEARFWRIGD